MPPEHKIFSAPTAAIGRSGGLRGGAALICSALAIATSLAGCGFSTSSTSSSSSTATRVNLNTPHIERAIELSILSQRHVHAKVVCPRVVPQEKGHNFTCIATVGKNTTPFAVTQQNNRGYVTYQAK